MSQEKHILNVIVVDEDAEPENPAGTMLQFMLLGRSKMKVYELTQIFVEAIRKNQEEPGVCNPHPLLMSVLGQLFANCLHLLATTEHRIDFTKEVAELFSRLAIEVEKVETGNAGGGRA